MYMYAPLTMAMVVGPPNGHQKHSLHAVDVLNQLKEKSHFFLIFRPYQIKFMFHRSTDSVFMTNKKTTIPFVVEHIKPRGEALWLRVHTVVSEVNYRMSTVEDGSFFCCHNNGSFVAQASIYQLFPWGPQVFHGQPTSPCLLRRDPALRLAACLVIPCRFQSRLYSLMRWNSLMVKWNGKTVISAEPDLTIESDVSNQGWGASCQGIGTGGPRSIRERSLHINCLELLAATSAVKTILRTRGTCQCC